MDTYDIRTQALPEEPDLGGETPTPTRPRSGGFSLLLVQSIACAAVLLLAFGLKALGGPLWQTLRDGFTVAMRDNAVATALEQLWHDAGDWVNPAATGEGDPTAPTTSKTDPTDATPAEPTDPTAPADATDPDASAVGGEDVAAAASAGAPLNTPEGVSLEPPAWSGRKGRPLAEGVVTSNFGWRENPIGGGIGFHQGLDIGAQRGTPIAAMWAGQVTEVGSSGSLGNYLRIEHSGGLTVLYAHCDSVSAKEGDRVKAGATVAAVGHTGEATGDHLHVETVLKDVHYDPAHLIDTAAYAPAPADD